MSNSIRFELEGLDDLLQMTEGLGKKGNRVENEALKRAGEYLLNEIKKETPIGKTRRLVEGFELSGVTTRKGIKGIDIKNEVYYLKFHEYGTSKMAANPFFTRTFEMHKSIAFEILKQQLLIGLGL